MTRMLLTAHNIYETLDCGYYIRPKIVYSESIFSCNCVFGACIPKKNCCLVKFLEFQGFCYTSVLHYFTTKVATILNVLSNKNNDLIFSKESLNNYVFVTYLDFLGLAIVVLQLSCIQK